MLNVTIVFKNGSHALNFEAADIELQTSSEEETYGQLVGYKFSTVGTKTHYVWFDPKEVAGVLAVGETVIEAPQTD